MCSLSNQDGALNGKDFFGAQTGFVGRAPGIINHDVTLIYRTPEYNEPKAMADYLVSHAVDQRHIVVDYAGRSTYETCLRAKEIFGVKQAILITQRTHISRALYLANKLGLDTIGVIADQQNYGGETSYQQIREIGASLKAFINVQFFPPSVILGEKSPIK